MSANNRFYFRLACLGLSLAVALGAFGAHGLRGHVDERQLQTFETAVRYQVYGCFGLQLANLSGCSTTGAVRLLLLGVIIFSGSLYLIVFTGIRAFGAVAPLGGLMLIFGWIWLAAGAYANEEG